MIDLDNLQARIEEIPSNPMKSSRTYQIAYLQGQISVLFVLGKLPLKEWERMQDQLTSYLSIQEDVI